MRVRKSGLPAGPASRHGTSLGVPASTFEHLQSRGFDELAGAWAARLAACRHGGLCDQAISRRVSASSSSSGRVGILMSGRVA